MGQIGHLPWYNVPLYQRFSLLLYLHVLIDLPQPWVIELCIDLYFHFYPLVFNYFPISWPRSRKYTRTDIRKDIPWLCTLLHELINSCHWLKVKLRLKDKFFKSPSILKSVSFLYIFAFLPDNKSSNPKGNADSLYSQIEEYWEL